MSLSIIHSRALDGLLAAPISVEVHLANGLPSFTVVGLADTEVKEARERVRAALQSSGLSFPSNKRITVNLAPADLPKEGARFDLPIALGLLAASGQIEAAALEQLECAGELSLAGELRPVRGALAMALAMKSVQNNKELLLPPDSAAEAALVQGVVVRQASLNEFISTVRRNTRRIQELFGLSVRADLVDDPVRSLSAILGLIGLDTIRTASYKVGDDRIREYQVDSGKLGLMMDIIARRASVSPQSTPLLLPLPKKPEDKKRGSNSRTIKIGKQEAADPEAWYRKKRAMEIKAAQKAKTETKLFHVNHQVQHLPVFTETASRVAENRPDVREIEDQPRPRSVGTVLAEVRAKHGTPTTGSRDQTGKMALNDSHFIMPRGKKEA